ncbi:MAG: ATP-binding protein [Actinomycetota bacterium]|nr:ATP-binding protein [Actinomycetota bacterium]
MSPEKKSRKMSRYAMYPGRASLASVREFIRSTLEPFSSISPHICDIITATHEACKNAIEHNPNCESPVDIVLRIHDEGVTVEVSDRGHGFEVRNFIPPEDPKPLAQQGRGLFLIYSLMDEVEATSSELGTTIRMQKRLTIDD